MTLWLLAIGSLALFDAWMLVKLCEEIRDKI